MDRRTFLSSAIATPLAAALPVAAASGGVALSEIQFSIASFASVNEMHRFGSAIDLAFVQGGEIHERGVYVSSVRGWFPANA